MARDNFIFYRSFFEGVDNLPQKNQLSLYKAIIQCALDDKEPNLNGIEKAIFALIKPQLAANNKRYEDGCKGAKYGALGGRPKKEKTPDTKIIGDIKNPIGDIENPIGDIKNNPVGIISETPNKNVNENDNISLSACAHEDENIKLFFKKHPSIEVDGYNGFVGEIDYQLLSERINESDYLKQITSFSWLCKQWQKIASGYYKTIKVDKLKKQESTQAGRYQDL